MERDVRIADLAVDNPNLEQVMRDWQAERHQKGESPFDWQTFRATVGYVGLADPGADPPNEFYWFIPPDTGAVRPSERVMTAEREATSPSAVLVTPGAGLRSTGGADSELTEMKYWR
ncbi:MAG: hypothetical protein IT305_27635 [Chloroflexi bacterium]|nr:hypothetical protein [Chloroflexota bacterium]